MGLFDIFRPTDINEELKNMKTIPGAVLLDVREEDEYKEEHIPNSINIPLSNLEQIEDMHYTKDTPLFVYCHSGRRSGAAVLRLRELGYTHAKNIGGIIHYKKA